MTQWVRYRASPAAAAAGDCASGLAVLEAWRAIERSSANVASRSSSRPGGFDAEKSTRPAVRTKPTQRPPAAGSRSNLPMVRTSYSLLDDDGQLHVAVSRAAEMVTDGGERAGRLRGDRYLLRLSRGEVGVDLQWPKEKAVRDVL